MGGSDVNIKMRSKALRSLLYNFRIFYRILHSHVTAILVVDLTDVSENSSRPHQFP